MNKMSVFLKSFIYQGNWNYENMQGSGFKYLLEEAKRSNNIEISDTDLESEDEYFNTHPFFVLFIVGVWLKEHVTGGDPKYYKKVYSSAFGALGDSFIWHSLRPISFIVAAIIGISNPILGMIFYLVLFNTFHIIFLYIGLDVGYELGKEVITWFNRVRFNKWAGYFDILSAFLIGIFLSRYMKTINHVDMSYYVISLLFLATGIFLGKKFDIMYGLIGSVVVSGLILILTGVSL